MRKNDEEIRKAIAIQPSVVFFFSTVTTESDSAKNARLRHTRCFTDEGQKINSRYDTDKEQVLICRRTFNVLDRTPNQGYHRFTHK